MEQINSTGHSANTHSERIIHADSCYREGKKVYIIPREKLARITEPMPTEDCHKLEFFRRHAEYVKIWEPSTMACKAPVDPVPTKR
jgi:hypothetical protein